MYVLESEGVLLAMLDIEGLAELRLAMPPRCLRLYTIWYVNCAGQCVAVARESL